MFIFILLFPFFIQHFYLLFFLSQRRVILLIRTLVFFFHCRLITVSLPLSYQLFILHSTFFSLLKVFSLSLSSIASLQFIFFFFSLLRSFYFCFSFSLNSLSTEIHFYSLSVIILSFSSFPCFVFDVKRLMFVNKFVPSLFFFSRKV